MQEQNIGGKDVKDIKYVISTTKDPNPRKVMVISCSKKDAQKIADILGGEIIQRLT